MCNSVGSKFFKNGFSDGLNMRLEVGNELGFCRISRCCRGSSGVFSFGLGVGVSLYNLLKN